MSIYNLDPSEIFGLVALTLMTLYALFNAWVGFEVFFIFLVLASATVYCAIYWMTF